MNGELNFNVALRKSRADQIFERFVQFHKANPDFWHLFCRFADSMRQVKSHYAVASIFERVRWERDMTTTTTDDDSLKLNNDYRAYYARMYLATHLSAEKFFELRKRTSEDRNSYNEDITFYKTGSAGDEEDLMQKLVELADESATPFMREPGEEG